ncbi:BRCT domain-containing protein [Ascodesmis nigricans]|uniref:BRCT domain-containing protein n=1 Tax=Ascodesmis nigricans TaxID=341454 RepID=A0A4S2MQR1_9PEZI|nr:BRCT domain-containing protein [Ascodesmis nigricans]
MTDSFPAVPAVPAVPVAPPVPQHEPRPLFDNVVFHIVTGPNLLDQEAKRISGLLTKHGAQECPPRTGSISIDFQVVSHLIAKDIDFPGYEDAERLMVTVVTPQWVYKSVETNKAQQIRPFTPDPRFFFSNITVTTADLPAGDKEAIVGGVIAMGGTVCSALRASVTHIVALNLNNEKCRIALQKKLKAKIVLPHWFDDCLKLRKRIDEKPYLLPNPEIERIGVDEPMELPWGPDLSYSHHHQGGAMGLPPPTLGEGYKIFNGDSVMLGTDLDLSSRMRGLLSQLIRQVNGQATDDINNAQVLICHWREGDEYLTASRKNLHVGNLTWLYWMLAHKKWTSPLSRLLHYPLVRGGLPSMYDKIITVSNYGGDARLYLESLIEAIGAKFTKSMKIENTHLITARACSEKYDAAKEWNIGIVNHLWLEESYAKWKEMTVTDLRYTHFPKRTNLMEIVGQTRLDKEDLKQFYEEDSQETAVEHPTSRSTGIVTENNLVSRAQSVPNGGEPKKPAQRRPASNAPASGPDVTPTPASRHDRRTELSEAPSTGRKAKEAAAARLHSEIMPDVALYQKEQKRKGGVVGGGRKRRSSVNSVENTERSHKRTTTSPDAEIEVKVTKKAKKAPKPTVILLLTAYTKWQDADRMAKDKKQLLELGIKCVEDATQCTHLAAPHLARTAKFCVAIARAPIILSATWVEDCLKTGSILDTSKYLLKDPENEKRLNYNLAESLARAKSNAGKLLAGQTIFVTTDVHGGFDVCKSIVEANGGVCVGWSRMKKPLNVPLSDPIVLLANVDTPSKFLMAFRRMAVEEDKEHRIYRSDWLLDLAMNQAVVWDGRYDVVSRS